MPKPADHTHQRNWLESIGRKIPGFRGYLEKEYRRDSDKLQRDYLAGRLQQSKKGLADYSRALVDAGNLDALPPLERVRARLDRLIHRITAAMPGYSGMFDLVQVKEDVLDRVYQHDVGLVDEVTLLADAIEKLPEKNEPPATVVTTLLKQIDELDELWDQREEILKGLG